MGNESALQKSTQNTVRLQSPCLSNAISIVVAYLCGCAVDQSHQQSISHAVIVVEGGTVIMRSLVMGQQRSWRVDALVTGAPESPAQIDVLAIHEKVAVVQSH